MKKFTTVSLLLFQAAVLLSQPEFQGPREICAGNQPIFEISITDCQSGEALSGVRGILPNGVYLSDRSLMATLDSSSPDSILEFDLAKEGYANRKVRLVAGRENAFCLFRSEIPQRPVGLDFPGEARLALNDAASILHDDALQSLQGRVAGLSLSRAGSDPNEGFQMRMRGWPSIWGNHAPHLRLNGVPLLDSTLLIPGVTDRYHILKDAAAGAIFGPGASPGVVLAQTASPEARRLQLRYRSEVAVGQSANPVEALSTAERNRLTDNPVSVLHNTPWLEEIRRTSLSQAHLLQMEMGDGRPLSGQLALRHANRAGILKKSRYRQSQVFGQVRYQSRDMRLQLSAEGFGSYHLSDLSPASLFGLALLMDPNLPVTSADPAFFQFGGYTNSFYYLSVNPVQVLAQNYYQGDRGAVLGIFRGRFDFLKNFSLQTLVSPQFSQQRQAKLLHDQSPLYSAGLGGYLSLHYQDARQLYVEPSLRYSYVRGGNVLVLRLLGAHVQSDFSNDVRGSENGWNYAKNARSLDEVFSLNLPLLAGSNPQYPNVLEQQSWEQTTQGAALTFDYHRKRFWRMNGGLRRDKSLSNKRLGSVWQPFLRSAFDLLAFKNANSPNRFLFSLAWGRSANLPGSANITENNAFETKSEWAGGMEFFAEKARLRATFNIFWNRAKHLNFSAFPALDQWAGQYVMRSRGMELSLFWQSPARGRSFFETTLHLWSARSWYADFPNPNLQRFISPGAPGNGNIFLNRAYEGGEAGAIWAVQQFGVNEQGQPIVQYDPNTFDNIVINKGRGLPRFWWSGQNALHLGAWSFHVDYRAAIGHSLVHENRAFFTEGLEYVQQRGILKNKYLDERMKGGGFVRDIHVEKASFLRIETLRLDRRIAFKNKKWLSDLTLSAGVRRPLTLSKYTGNDPEVRFTDNGPFDSHIYNLGASDWSRDPRGRGVDRRGTYELERAYFLALRADF